MKSIYPYVEQQELSQSQVSIPLWSEQYMKFAIYSGRRRILHQKRVSIPLWSGQYMKSVSVDVHWAVRLKGFNPLVVGAIYEIDDIAMTIEDTFDVSIPLWSGQYMKYTPTFTVNSKPSL